MIRAVLALFLASTASAAQAPPTFRLGDAATPAAYDVRFAIDPREERFTGEARIELRIHRATPVLWLNATDIEIEAATLRQDDRDVAVDVVAGGEDFVGLKARGDPFAAGAAVASLRYRGKLESRASEGIFRRRDGGEWYVMTQFEDVSARRALPCFDEPEWKTPWRITIDAPSAYGAFANTPETGAAPIADRPGWTRHEFAATQPLPTYLVALAVGPYDVVDGGAAGAKRTPLRYLVPKGRGPDARYAREATPKILEWLEGYFGIPYPFEKLDSLARPDSVRSFAMENVGLITYGTDSLLARPREETPRFFRHYTSIGAHEIAHMWFGDLVTMKWWDDAWLNEGFATWIALKAMYRLHPEWDTGVYRSTARDRAIAVDRLASARRVRNPVNSKDDISGAFDSISYEKAGTVLEMFEQWMGEERFRQGVRDYLARHAWGSATSEDFFRAIGAASGRPETVAALQGFVDQPGVPLIDVALRCEKGSASLEISQQRLRPVGSKAEERDWMTPACFRYPGRDGKVHTQCAEVRKANAPLKLASADRCPAWILGNAGGTGHYVVRYAPADMKRITGNARALPEREVTAFLGDAAVLAESGLATLDAALEAADAGLRHASPGAQFLAVRLLETLRDPWLTPAQAKRKGEIVRRRVLPLARKVGWLETPGEPDPVKDLRTTLMPYAAEREAGGALRREARRLALAWTADRSAVPQSMVPAVLDTAARFADRETYGKLEPLALADGDGVERRQVHAALAKVRDPALRERALGLLLGGTKEAPAVRAREVTLFLMDASEDEANRSASFAFVRTNFDALVERMSRNAPAFLPGSLKGLCTRAERDLFGEFFRERAPRFEGGKRRYDEALEAIDLCVAAHG